MNVLELLTRSESKTLEFKRDLSSINPILKTIVAFANTAGGMLIIGVGDNKEIFGIDDPLKAEERLTSLIADNIVPLLLPDICIFSVKNKSLLIIEVPHVIGPFYMKKGGIESGIMVRLGSSTRQASPELIAEIQNQRAQHSFDQQPCYGVLLKDLDRQLIDSTLIKTNPQNMLAKLKTLNIVLQQGNQYIATNAGVILFAKSEIRQRHFPNASVSCARFSGINKSSFIDQIDIEDGILSAVDAVPKFIRRNTRMSAEIKQIKRKDIPEYPPVAVREGLLNALMHADFANKGTKITVAIFDDRLEIRNPGNFPLGMTIDDFKNGISKVRNPIIARIFKELGWVEAWGSGYTRIKNACDKQNYPIPEWQEIGGCTEICFRSLLMTEGLSRHQVGTKSAPSRHQVGTKSAPSRHFIRQNTMHLEYQQFVQGNEEQLRILSLCKAPTSIQELMTAFGWKDRSKFRKKFITPLLDAGLLEMTIPDKPNSRLQCYRTVSP